MVYKNRIRRNQRKGAAVIEAAIALPIVFFIILGTVEICNGVFLTQSLSLMAYEGARVAVIPDSSLDDIRQQVEDIAAARGVATGDIQVEPSNFSDQPAGTFIEVRVSADQTQPGRTNLFGYSNKTISVFIMKEQ